MSRSSASEVRTVMFQLLASIAIGLLLAIFASDVVMRRIDGMLVTAMSIIVAAAIPGIALTVAAQRPVSASPYEANEIGSGLLKQVRFWFSYIWVGGLSLTILVIGSALDWSLPAPPRPIWMPEFTPQGGYWLVSLALAGVIFTSIRTANIVNAAEDLVKLGTKSHVAEAVRRELAEASSIDPNSHATDDQARGQPLGHRPRH